MTSAPALLDTVELETAANPTHAVIWMHGLGADGNDFAPIVPHLSWPGAPAIRFVFPHAQVRPVTINGGMPMRAWYDIFQMAAGVREDHAGIHQSAGQIEALIAREHARGIPSANIVLAGFSQGCAMTLHTGLRYPETLAGLIALSGYLPLADTLAEEHSAANQQTPIFMAHGTQDPIVIPARAETSRRILDSLGYQIEWRTYPMPHSVCPQEIADIAVFLKTVLSAQ